MSDLLIEFGRRYAEASKWPICIMAHNMGGEIAYELKKRMKRKGRIAQYFLIPRSHVPSIQESNPIYHLPDDEFKKEIVRLEGTPKEILENQELLNFFLTILRADFTMDETYYDKEFFALQSPIEAF